MSATYPTLIGEAVRTLPHVGALVGRGEIERLAVFLALLEDWNARVNLVSRKVTREDLVTRHLLDALEALPLLPARREAIGNGPVGRRAALVDIGSGGGFPALPLLVCRPDLSGVLVEATGKKCAFLRAAIERLELTARVVNARFPDCFSMETPWDVSVVTSRAVAGIWPAVRRVPGLWKTSTIGLFWTTVDAWNAVAEPLCKSELRRSALGERRAIAVVKCST